MKRNRSDRCHNPQLRYQDIAMTSFRDTRIAAFFLLAAVALPLQATDADLEAFKEKLTAALGGHEVLHVGETPLPGVYEAVIGSEVMYLSDDLRYVIQGKMIDLVERRDLSDEVLNTVLAPMRLGRIEALGEENMIVFGPSDAKRTITVFTDVSCPYCIKLHREVPELNKMGIRVRYLFYPRAGKGSAAYNAMVSVWCAEDRQAALTAAKFGGNVEPATCENPVDAHLELAHSFGLRGTPAIVTDSGRLLPGYMPAKQLAAQVFAEEPLVLEGDAQPAKAAMKP
jgi:thiol:disulfide interchange protein DsbC